MKDVIISREQMKSPGHLDYVYALDDDRFDLIYPSKVRELSSCHWTPVTVARRTAAFLVTKPGTRVLDIGCGPGKFCIVGALATGGKFTGVEQRKHLCDIANSVIKQAEISNAEIIHRNVTEIDFSNFDAFYLFNPFEENLETTLRIDATVDLSGELYEQYAEYVARQLALAPIGTRVATYCGICEEVPLGYDCVHASVDGLRFWEKTKNHSVRTTFAEEAASQQQQRVPIRHHLARLLQRSRRREER